MQMSDRLDELTRTFEIDKAFAQALLTSSHREQVAELLLSHAWANKAFPICHKALSRAASRRFGPERGEKAADWTFILTESLHRDMRLVPYLALRGLLSDAGVALRRAFEHVGVVTHIWRDQSKLEALEDPDSDEYCTAFRREPNPVAAKALKLAGVAKRFSAMGAGSAATKLYERLSAFHVHGGTSRHLIGQELRPTAFTCSFYSRPVPDTDYVGQQLGILTDGHKLLSAEMMNLCVEYAEHSEDVRDAVQTLSVFAWQDNHQTPELLTAIQALLHQLGTIVGDPSH